MGMELVTYDPAQVLAPVGNGSVPPVRESFSLTRKAANPASRFQGQAVADGSIGGEIGTTGLRQYGGFVVEEWLTQLQGRRAAWAYREMMDNDPVVGAILFAIEMLARGVNWRVEEDKGSERAEFVETCMHDMSHTWLDFISEALSMLPYGWSFHEIVYKHRRGYQRPLPMAEDELRSGIAWDRQEDTAFEQASSEFEDGKIGWRKLPVRAQETLLKWRFDGYSGLRAMEQVDWHGGDHVIPIEKALLFRTKTTRKNPEGRSILRNAWTAFYRMTNIQQIEAIGIERELAGIPVATPPEGVDLNLSVNREVREAVQEMVESIRKDEQQGVVLPTAGWKLELLSAAGGHAIDTDTVIRRYEQRIASSCLADFVLLGQDAIGSYAMVDIKAQLFGVAVDTVLDIICQVMNEHAIPRLLALNGMDIKEPPRITHSSAGRIDLEKVGRFLQSVALAGGPIPWSRELLEEMFKEAGLPARFDGAIETEQHSTGGVTPALERGGERPQGPQNDGRERALPRRTGSPERQASMSKSDRATGAMIALYPQPEDAQALKVKGAEKAKELHLTLAYLGPADQLTPEQISKLQTIVAGWAATCPPLEGTINGLVCFDTDEGDCYAASVDAQHLSKKQGRLRSLLLNGGVPEAGGHGFQPHITLSYGKQCKPPKQMPICFYTVSLVIGGHREDFRLTGDPAALSKADDSEGEPGGVPGLLRARAQLLTGQLQQEMDAALRVLGEEASSAYLHEIHKAERPSRRELEGAARRVMNRLNVRGWVESHLVPILRNHAGRVTMDTQRELQREMHMELGISDQEAARIAGLAGSLLRSSDLEPQIVAQIMNAVATGVEQGWNPIRTARLIREQVPGGRFTHAGPKYRAELIARNETSNIQREASLASYRSNPRIRAVRLTDGIYGPPRSDAACIERDGEIVPIDQADRVAPYHPLCTLGFEPVVG